MPESIRELVERSKTGDNAAYSALYDHFERSIYALCRQLLGDSDAARDAVQETFVTVWQNLPRLRHPEAFATWLRGAAVNACRWHRRKARRTVSWPTTPDGEPEALPADDATPAEAHLREELSGQVRQALSKLSEPHREVVVLHHLQGLPLEDIAATLGVAVGTVKSRLGRARGHLERLLTSYLEE